MMEKRGPVLVVMALLVITAVASRADAVSIHDGAGTVGAAFLKIEGGSRPVGMGWRVCRTCQ